MWNEGYISEIDYLYGYFSELCPIRLKLALLSRGIAHSVSSSPTYLELGFGQGLSLNINAAATSGHYFGTDFNPAQAAHARMLADSTGKNVEILDQSFEELAARNDLPQFDIIALHGIWSWISESSRGAILKLVRERLKAGGILYVSYNVTPGWSPAVPLRHLLNEYSRRAATGGILSRVEQSISFVERIIAAGAGYFSANPALADRLAAIKDQDRNYVSHEYFNHHWRPESFSDVHDVFAEAKMNFGASANIIDNIPGISTPANAGEILASISNDVLRETTLDYFVNQQFRRDIFVKGPRRMNHGEVPQAVAEQRFILLGDLQSLPKTVRSAAGDAELRQDIYGPVAEVMNKNGARPISVRAMSQDQQIQHLPLAQIWEALLVLVGSGFVAPVGDSDTPEADSISCARLNKAICERARYSASMQYLAAPVIGSAIQIGRIEQIFLLAVSEGSADPVAFTWQILEQQGERLVVDGQALEGPDENCARLREMFEIFETKTIPVLRAIGVTADFSAPSVSSSIAA